MLSAILVRKLVNVAFFFSILWASSSSVIAAEFSWIGKQLVMRGEIESGDYDRIISISKYMSMPPLGIHIDSPGGLVDEAIKIGRMARGLGISVSVISTCASACVLILIGSPERIVTKNSKVGLHRTFLMPEYYAKLTATEARFAYQQVKRTVTEYLKEMGAPERFKESMYSISSKEMLILSGSEFNELIPSKAEFLYELSLAKCGSGLSESEQRAALFSKPSGFSDAAIKALQDVHFEHMTCSMNLFADERGKFMKKHILAAGTSDKDTNRQRTFFFDENNTVTKSIF